jgi:rfaE bifunctional protein nucleotidyltransferase chain/domain
MKTNALNLKIWNEETMDLHLSQIHATNKSIVFTNGCFDIVHAGHIQYLFETSKLADYLIVGINSDNSVKRLEKSPARPLQNEFSRSSVIAALGFVDAVILFDQDTPKQLIERITPKVLVKGSDYKIEDIVGSDWVISHGGEVKTIDFLPGYSTSSIERKILQAHNVHE